MDTISTPSILLLLFLPIFSSLLLFLWNRKKDPVIYAPSLKPYPLVGHLPQFLANRHRALDWVAEVLAEAPNNTVVFQRLGGVREVETANSANVEHILRTHFENYPKGEMHLTILHDFLGAGIFNSDGERWRVQRKIASSEFNTRSLRSFVVQCVHQEIQTRLLPLLAKASVTSRVVDLQDVLERFAFDSICMVSFDHDPGCLDPELEKGGLHDEKGSGFTTIFAEAFRFSFPSTL
jgi:cytochrome P450